MQKWQNIYLHKEISTYKRKKNSEAQHMKLNIKIMCKYFFPNIASDLF